MNIIAKILCDCNVLLAEYTSSGDYSLRMRRYRVGTEGVGEPLEDDEVQVLGDAAKSLNRLPLILAVSGYGVLSKDAESSADIVGRVRAEGSGFIWSEEGDVLTFVREEQVAPLIEQLKTNGIRPMLTACVGQDKDAVGRMVDRVYSEYANFKALLRPSAVSSRFAQQLAGKLKMPMLGVVLLVLVVNFMVSGGVRSTYEARRAEMQAIENERGQENEVSSQRKQAIEQFGRAFPEDFSFICDRVALAVPGEITLRSLEVQPLIRPAENGKKLQLMENRVTIKGESPDSERISFYASSIEKLKIVAKVNLTAVEQEPETGLLVFRIDLEL